MNLRANTLRPHLDFNNADFTEDPSSLTVPELIGELSGVKTAEEWEHRAIIKKWERHNKSFVRGWRMRQMLSRKPGLIVPRAQEYMVGFGVAPDADFALNAIENTVQRYREGRKELPEDYTRDKVFVTGSLLGSSADYDSAFWNIYALGFMQVDSQAAYRMWEIPHNPNI